MGNPKQIKYDIDEKKTPINLNDIDYDPIKMGSFGILPKEIVAYILTFFLTKPSDFSPLPLFNKTFWLIIQKLPLYNEFKQKIPAIKQTMQVIRPIFHDEEKRKQFFPELEYNDEDKIEEALLHLPETQINDSYRFFTNVEGRRKIASFVKGGNENASFARSYSCKFVPTVLGFLTAVVLLITGYNKNEDTLIFIGVGILVASTGLGLAYVAIALFCFENVYKDINKADSPIYDLKIEEDEDSDENGLLLGNG